MARNKSLFLYNLTKVDQTWSVYAAGVINERYTVGQTRKTFTLSLSGDTTIQFGVDDTVYLRATYSYSSDSWTSHTDTPNEMSFSVAGSAVSVSSSFEAGGGASSPRPRRVGSADAPAPVDLGPVRPERAFGPGQDPTGTVRPLVGGIRLSGTRAVGTLGLVVVSEQGATSLLTAGHVAGAVDTFVEQPGAGVLVGKVHVNGYTDTGGVDVAATSVLVGVQAAPWAIFGTLVDYSVTDIGYWPEEGQGVTMQGAESGASNGTVVVPNATVTFQNVQLQGVSTATYASVPGDSGAPVTYIDGDSVTLLGIHGGAFISSGQRFAWFTPVATIDTVFEL